MFDFRFTDRLFRYRAMSNKCDRVGGGSKMRVFHAAKCSDCGNDATALCEDDNLTKLREPRLHLPRLCRSRGSTNQLYRPLNERARYVTKISDSLLRRTP